jgi:hypothetical protein
VKKIASCSKRLSEILLWMMERVLNFLALTSIAYRKRNKQKEMGVILTFFIHVNYYVGIVS